MVNLKNYTVVDDFSHHKEEFSRTFEIIRPHINLNNKMTLNLCSGTGLHTGFLVRKVVHVNRGRSSGL